MLAALATLELEIVEPGAHRTVRLPLPILIGRDLGATLVLSDGQVSRLHARIDLEAGELRCATSGAATAPGSTRGRSPSPIP